MTSLAWLISGNWSLAATYAGLLFVAYVMCAIAAQNYAVRLVQNVLSVASVRSLERGTR
jgi:hypothetical protein